MPLVLGLAGAIPFVALAAPVAPNLPFDLPEAIMSCRAQLQAGYGATILSFLGEASAGRRERNVSRGVHPTYV